MYKKHVLFFVFNLISLFAAPVSEAANNPKIISFYPTGTVKQVKQVTVCFATDMVTMGDPRTNNNIFKIFCNPNKNQYKTRWADSKNWVLDFEEPMTSGVKCSFTLRKNLTDLSGQKIENSQVNYAFSTGGPALKAIFPQKQSEIESDQYFIILTEGGVDPQSIQKNAYFEAERIPDKIKIKLIQGAERENLIKFALKNNWEWNSYAEKFNRQEKSFNQIKEMENFFVLAATRRFPEKSKIVFHWPKGILSTTGIPVEEAQNFQYKTLEPFKGNFSCSRTAPEKQCDPIQNMSLIFSKNLTAQTLYGTKLISKDGQIWLPTELKPKNDLGKKQNPLNSSRKQNNLEDKEISSLTFKGPFPDSTKFSLILPENVRDQIGRKLVNANNFPLTVFTDESSPLVKFAANFGIIEAKSEPALPVSVRNTEQQIKLKVFGINADSLDISDFSKTKQIFNFLKTVENKANDYLIYGKKQNQEPIDTRNSPILTKDQGQEFKLPKLLNSKELEVIGIPLKKPGFYVVEAESPRLGATLTKNKKPMYVASTALVTDMAVHFKKGQKSSLVWVTSLANAKPIDNADIYIVSDTGKELAEGKTDRDGILKLPAFKIECNNNDDYNSNCEYFILAQKKNDFSFTSNKWSKGIEPFRFNVDQDNSPKEWGGAVMQTILDRMLANKGNIIHMKHVLRAQSELGFSKLNAKYLPKQVLIVHAGSQKTYSLPFVFNKSTGNASNTFIIPKDAALGNYNIYLSQKDPTNKKESEQNNFSETNDTLTGSFTVSEYRLPLISSSVKIQGENLVHPKLVQANLSANYLTGGPAQNLKVKLRANLQPGYFDPNIPGGSNFNFFSDPMKEGVFDPNSINQSKDDSFLSVQNITLNSDGNALASVKNLPQSKQLKSLVLEMEYTDPNGEIKTSSVGADLFPADYIVGLQADNWIASSNNTKLSGIILNNHAKPINEQKYRVKAFQSNYITHRKRLIGGFYSYDSKTEIVSLGTLCEGQTNDKGRFNCEPKNLPAGDITFQAETIDTQGRPTFAKTSVDIYAEGTDNWWVPSDSDRVDLIPEKNEFEPGEKAKFVVRTPFKNATVLVTVEREGVLDSFVQELKRDNPMIEIPIKGNYAPNVFISALLVRGRVGEPKPTGLLDLARPSMKMGLTGIKVGLKEHELLVKITTNQQKYHPHEKVLMDIEVKSPNGKPLPEGAEVAIAALDESLMELKENTSWNILQNMMGTRGLAVQTSSGENQVIGKRHYGAKAKAPGGGGALRQASFKFNNNDPRERFEPLLYWNSKVELNKSGKARVSIPLNDSLTSFRLVAIATAGDNLFGNEKTFIQSTKDLIIYSGFAPVAHENDKIKSVLTVRNTSDKPMTISLSVKSKEIPELQALPSFELKANDSKIINIPITIPQELKKITFQINAKDHQSGKVDSLIVPIKVEPLVLEQVQQATLFQLDQTKQIPIKQPSDSIIGRGRINIQGSASLTAGLSGVKSYMNAYPFNCFEQQISRGIVLENKKEIKKLIEELPAYLDKNGLIKFFQTSTCGSSSLTRYVMNILHDNEYKIPTQTQKQLIAGLNSVIQGKSVCNHQWSSLDPQEKQNQEGLILLLDTLSRYESFSPSLLTTIKVTPNLWKTETLVAWIKLLKREKEIEKQQKYLATAYNILHARVNFQGSTMNLQNKSNSVSEWQLFTSADQEALGVFGLSIDDDSFKEDSGRMARGIMARLKQGRFDTSMANAWAVTEFKKFSAEYEKEHVEGQTNIVTGESTGTLDWKSSDSSKKSVSLNWPKIDSTHTIENNSTIQFRHVGEGKPWIYMQTLAAIPLKAPFNMGYKIKQRLIPVTQTKANTWSVGDVVNVELTITAQSDEPWVVIRAPIPAGTSHLGTGLSGVSQILDQTPNKNQSNVNTQEWPTEYEEKSNSYFTSYASYLPAGTYVVNYRIRLNSAGQFQLPPTRIEAMYAQEIFGEIPGEKWTVLTPQ